MNEGLVVVVVVVIVVVSVNSVRGTVTSLDVDNSGHGCCWIYVKLLL
jgi:hypothetical protein